MEIPRELANPAGRERYSSEFAYHNDTTFVSYKSHPNRCVLMLSSQHHDGVVHNERADRKPEIILEYNRTKGGVDCVDQQVAEFTCVRPAKRWPLKV